MRVSFNEVLFKRSELVYNIEGKRKTTFYRLRTYSWQNSQESLFAECRA